MDKLTITENLINSYELPFGNGTVTINEYAPSFTKEEQEINDMMIKSILAKVFRNDV